MCLAETGQRKTPIVDQLAQDHPQVVRGAARHCVDRVTQRALESVPIEFAADDQMHDAGLDLRGRVDRLDRFGEAAQAVD